MYLITQICLFLIPIWLWSISLAWLFKICGYPKDYEISGSFFIATLIPPINTILVIFQIREIILDIINNRNKNVPS